MKGLIFDIKRYAVHDGPGIRTTVFFKGCPLHCPWCHNPEGIRKEVEEVVTVHKMDGKDFPVKEKVGRWMTVEEVMREINKERMFMEESGGGVTLSGGEPLWQVTFLEDLLRSCKKAGIHTALDTTGYASRKTIVQIMDITDLFLYDIKHMDDQVHIEYTGVSNKPVLDNLSFIAGHKKNIFIRIPVIPTINDDKENLSRMIDFLIPLASAIQEVDLLPYHAMAIHKYKKFHMENGMIGIPEPSEEEMNEIMSWFEQAGFKVNIGG